MQVLKYRIFLQGFNMMKVCQKSLSAINKCIIRTEKINFASKNVALDTRLPAYNGNSKLVGSIFSGKFYCTASDLVDSVTFEKVCDETLESLCEYFEELVEQSPHLQSADITYGSGVLTVNFGNPHGTYVINRQSPNRQIWLSSPTSGPKRYDFMTDGNYWIYKHDNITLHQLLQQEIKGIVQKDVDFSKCSYSLLATKPD